MTQMSHADHQIDYTRPNYPRNCWWVAARQDEVGRTPLGRWLLDRPVVLYRREDGTAVAMENRCMHRWAPISSGFLEGDNIVCGYHGATFGPDGRCLRYPTQDRVPGHARVHSYPVLERAPFIWIWMGDPGAIGTSPEPHAFDWVNDPGWLVAEGYTPYAGNYFLLQENVLDLTHFNFLHLKTFGVSDQPAPTFETVGDMVVFRLLQEHFQIPSINSDLAAKQVSLRREMYNRFVTPALHEGEVRMTAADGSGGPILQSQVFHCVTPASPGETHYWWAFGQNFGVAPGAREVMQRIIETAAAEDKVMLEALQEMMTRDERGIHAPELSFKGDGGGVMARRVLQRLLWAEA